ncbi:MAG: class I SAM-dependent methyltransferase [Methanolinea sp.]|nr:class I SAM-dependent methyltransferase [Methanolinea sp.]
MDETPLKHRIAEMWDSEADNYDNHVSHGIQTREEKRMWEQVFREVLPPAYPLHILDAGCGTGAMGLLLAGMGHIVTGIDLSPRMMAIAKRKAEEYRLPVTFLHGDAESPPFGPESFDVIVARHLFWTLPHPGETLRRWHALLRPGGAVILIEGIWFDGRLETRIRRGISLFFARIFEKHPHGARGYDPHTRRNLPYHGGLPEAAARESLKNAGFCQIVTRDLREIKRAQFTRMPWYERIQPVFSYYLISGRKPSSAHP